MECPAESNRRWPKPALWVPGRATRGCMCIVTDRHMVAHTRHGVHGNLGILQQLAQDPVVAVLRCNVQRSSPILCRKNGLRQA